MRIPHVHKYHLENVDTIPEETVEVDVRPQPYIDDLGLFEDRKEYIQFIIRLKQLIRNSREYVNLIAFLKKKRGMNHCMIHPNLRTYEGHRIELHHSSMTLEDYCTVVINKRKIRNESLKMGLIAREVMELHYLQLVGLAPLCMLCHAAIHDTSGAFDDFYIPMANVFGDPIKFHEIYQPYFPQSLEDKWNSLMVLEKGYSLIEQHVPIGLQKKYIYVHMNDHEDGVDVISTKKLAGFIKDMNK